MAKGKVYLVGAGPGDIGLLTVKGLQCLRQADVVVYDFHLNAQILNYIKGSAEFIYAGKRGGHHEMTQEEINRVLVEKAMEGKRVCRLKGGDPFVFGRGGEEAEVLAEAGIEFEVVPGISSAIAVPAYAGIPLTHREYSSSFVVLPGNEASTKESSNINWPELAKFKGTIVFLMAVKNIERVTSRLIQEGKSPDTPVAVIRWGTRADQKTLISTLGSVSADIKDREIRPPAVVVIGEVVRLRQKLAWFEKKPLFGQRVLLTREHSTAVEKLEELGAEIIQFPTIKIVPPESWDELDRAIQRIDNYHWIVFTSQNGVSWFFHRYFELGNDIRDLKGLKVCAVGERTAESLKQRGIRVDLVPEKFRAEGLVEAFGGAESVKGLRILLPRAEVAREVFPEKMRALGAQVDVVTTYRAVKPSSHARRLKRFLSEGKITVATFTSGANFKNFCEMIGDDVMELLKGVIIAVIGPVTKKAVEEKGLKVHIMPERATMDALVEAIISYFKEPIDR
ncbi:MAG: uroporphyrinogen-III C-methyltransferase [Nitrospirae bacterium]|nr:MAG: uroporphyrinogen-III C-methyltransferase [Nitrospirota bacterium]